MSSSDRDTEKPGTATAILECEMPQLETPALLVPGAWMQRRVLLSLLSLQTDVVAITRTTTKSSLYSLKPKLEKKNFPLPAFFVPPSELRPSASLLLQEWDLCPEQ